MRVVMLTDDGRNTDRRIILEALTLMSSGAEVIIVGRDQACQTYEIYDHRGITCLLINEETDIEALCRDLSRRTGDEGLAPRKGGSAGALRGAGDVPENRRTWNRGSMPVALSALTRRLARWIARASSLRFRGSQSEPVPTRHEITLPDWCDLSPVIPEKCGTTLEDWGLSPWERMVFTCAKALRPNVVHAHDLPQLLPAVRAARDLGVPVIYDAHEVYPEISTLTPELSDYYRRKENFCIPYCDARITVNEFCAAFMQRKYGCSPFHIIYNMASAQAAAPASPLDVKSLLGIPLDHRIVLYQGWIADVGRGIRELIESFRHVRSPTSLVLIGHGDKAAFKAFAEHCRVGDRVHFVDHIPSDALIAWTLAADVGVIPYQAVDFNHYACSPNKLFEYISAGLPLIVNDLPFLRKVVGGEGFGCVCDMRSPEAIAAAIDAFFGEANGIFQKAKRAVLSQNARWDWKTQDGALLGIYASLHDTQLAAGPRYAPDRRSGTAFTAPR